MYGFGNAGDDATDSKLRRKVQRLAVRHTNINGHLCLASDPDNEAARWPGQVYIYPSLKMVAVVEVLASVGKRTENLRIRPKRNVPDKLPDKLCPYKAITKTQARLTLWNRFHQEVVWGVLQRGKDKLRTEVQKLARALPVQPKSPGKFMGIAQLTVVESKSQARHRGIPGPLPRLKKDLQELVRQDEEMRFAALQK
jgi:hypothetical protein